MSTDLDQLEAIELGDDGGQWIVRGTTHIDTAVVTVVRLLVDQIGSEPETLGTEVVALVEAAKTAQVERHWYFVDDGIHDPVLRASTYRNEQTGKTFMGVLLGQDRVEVTR